MLVNLGGHRPREGLVELLLECHARIRRFCGLAVGLGLRAELPPAEVAEACQRCARYFVEALPLHVEDEEVRVLPLVEGRRAELDQALAAMRAQHREHDGPLAELLGALAALRTAPGDGPARARVLAAATALSAAFEPHLELEERVIFPAIAALVPPEAQQRAVEALRARRQR